MRSTVVPGEGVQGVHPFSSSPADNLLLKIYASQCRVEDQLGKLAEDQRKLMVEQKELASAIASVSKKPETLRSTRWTENNCSPGKTSLRNTAADGKQNQKQSAYQIEEMGDHVPQRARLSSATVDRHALRLTNYSCISNALSEQSDGERCTVSTVSARFGSEVHVDCSIKQTYLTAITIRKELEVMPPKPHGRASVQELIVNRALKTAEHLKVELEIDDAKRCTIPLEPHSTIPLVFNLIGFIVFCMICW